MVSCNVAGLPVEDKLKLRKIHILNKDIIQTCDFNQVHRSYLVSDIAAVLFVGLTEVGVGVVLLFDVIVEAVVDVDVGTVEVDDVVDKVLMLVDTVVVDEVVDEAVVLVDTVVVAAVVDVVVEAVVDIDVGTVLLVVVEAVVDSDVGTVVIDVVLEVVVDKAVKAVVNFVLVDVLKKLNKILLYDSQPACRQSLEFLYFYTY